MKKLKNFPFGGLALHVTIEIDIGIKSEFTKKGLSKS